MTVYSPGSWPQIFPLCTLFLSLPGTSWSPRPTCPALGSACASGHWFHPSRHKGSYNGPDRSQTPSCTGGAARQRLSLGTAWSGILRWRHELIIKSKLRLWQKQKKIKSGFLPVWNYNIFSTVGQLALRKMQANFRSIQHFLLKYCLFQVMAHSFH